MTLRTIDDPESVARLRQLLPYLEAHADHFETISRTALVCENIERANQAAARAVLARTAATRVRDAILRAERETVPARLGLADACAEPEPPKHVHTDACPIVDCADWLGQEEPPSTLVPFVGWLRARFGHLFPSAPSEVWQVAAYALFPHRRRP